MKGNPRTREAGAALARLMAERGLGDAALARLAGMRRGDIWKIRNGRLALPAATAVKLSAALGVSLEPDRLLDPERAGTSRPRPKRVRSEPSLEEGRCPECNHLFTEGEAEDYEDGLCVLCHYRNEGLSAAPAAGTGEEREFCMSFQVRQGDVFIERIESIPDGLERCPRENGRVVLAHGEVTFHSHAIAERDVELLARPGETVGEAAERWLRVGAGGAVLGHEEHRAIVIEPGEYRVVHQREWQDDDEPLLVVD